jgi:hypothetical protein
MQEMSHRPRIFRSPNDPDLGTPMTMQGDMNSMLPGYWVPLSGHDDPKSSPAIDRGPPLSGTVASSKRSRLPSQHMQALERSRRERVAYVLDRSMRTTQKEATRDRRARGTIVDAWVKIRSLPPDYDTDDDELHRQAGIDEFTHANDIDDAEDIGKIALIGDIGAQDALLARAWRRTGRQLQVQPYNRRRRHTRREEQMEDPRIPDHADVIVIDEDEADYDMHGEGAPDTPVQAASASLKRKRTTSKRKSRAAEVAEDEMVTPRPSSAGGRARQVKHEDDDGSRQIKPEGMPDDEAAELLLGMTSTMAGGAKEHGAALMQEAEAMLSRTPGQGEVEMGDA